MVNNCPSVGGTVAPSEREIRGFLLVQEQLDAGHIEMSTSPWNSPVFVIKKKSGKWRILTDLRKVNEVIQPMGPLQPRLPSPTMIPQNWSLIIDLKDCFFHNSPTARG